jgi:hypothetical protein
MKSCLGFLEANQRVLVLFFDQFEELFVKESLYETFEAFRRLSYVVEELQSNIVLGFSWRTGISIPDSHPAHHIWHELRDRRAEFGLGPFSASEAAEMVNTLEKVSEKIENPLKRHLIEQSQSLPWLLKKLCIHVFRKLQSGVSQRELVGSQLDARTLFAEDTQDLQGNEIKCLKYIAGNSPADIVDVNEQFGPEIPDRLYGNRLVIKSGHRYTVYWDIFREFLISGEVPAIPITYIPQSQLSTALNVLRFVRSRESTRLDGICKGFNYTIKTVWNIVGDLSAFFLIERVTPDTIKIADDLRTEDDIDIATHLSEDLSQHIVYIYLKNRVQAGQELSMQEVESIFAEAYQSHNLNTLHVYANRLLPWLNFSGLIEIENDCLIRPLTEGRGKRKGKVEHRRSILSGGKPVFVCSASPRRVVELAHRLCVRGELTRTEVEHTSNRNAALDLKALELADWNKKKLRPINDLKQITSDVKSEPDIWNACYELIKERALASTFLNLMADELGKSESASEDYLHTAIKKALNREWQPESAVRYINAGKSWLGYFRQLPKIKGQQSLFDNDF